MPHPVSGDEELCGIPSPTYSHNLYCGRVSLLYIRVLGCALTHFSTIQIDPFRRPELTIGLHLNDSETLSRCLALAGSVAVLQPARDMSILLYYRFRDSLWLREPSYGSKDEGLEGKTLLLAVYHIQILSARTRTIAHKRHRQAGTGSVVLNTSSQKMIDLRWRWLRAMRQDGGGRALSCPPSAM